MKKYHVYIDEGGMFGIPRFFLSDKKITETTHENNILSYYKGCFDLTVLCRYIQGLKANWNGRIDIQMPSECLSGVKYHLGEEKFNGLNVVTTLVTKKG